jgi:hypothetical protein
MEMTHREFFDRVSLSFAKVEDLAATLLYYYAYTAAEAFFVSRNISLMTNAPVPPSAANNLLTTEYDIYLLQDSIHGAFVNHLGDKRHKHIYVDDEWKNMPDIDVN